MSNKTGALRLQLSKRRVLAFSLVSSSVVLIASLLLQWFIYDDWMHQTGPLRIVGTVMAAVATFVFVYRWELAARERQAAAIKRFETIARMNDVIRNALQAIECITYASNPHATEPLREAVAEIDEVLREVVDVSRPRSAMTERSLSATSASTSRRPA